MNKQGKGKGRTKYTFISCQLAEDTHQEKHLAEGIRLKQNKFCLFYKVRTVFNFPFHGIMLLQMLLNTYSEHDQGWPFKYYHPCTVALSSIFEILGRRKPCSLNRKISAAVSHMCLPITPSPYSVGHADALTEMPVLRRNVFLCSWDGLSCRIPTSL